MIWKRVYTDDRLPTEEGKYYVMYFNGSEDVRWFGKGHMYRVGWVDNIEYWLEPIPEVSTSGNPDALEMD